MAISIQQAATNAFVTYLRTKMPDCTIESRWPSPDRQFVSKTITVLPAGPRQDTPIDARILSNANLNADQVRSVWQVAACYQPYQLDIWSTGYAERDDLIARLDTFLRAGDSSLTGVFNPDPVGPSVLIAVGDGWEESQTTADFVFEEPDVDDNPDSVARSQYRVTYRGGAHFMLTIPATAYRQKVIKLSLLLDGDTTRTLTTT